MFKANHGIAPTYLSDRIVMNFDVNGYDIFEIVFLVCACVWIFCILLGTYYWIIF